jgi:periplasmic protein TonB
MTHQTRTNHTLGVRIGMALGAMGLTWLSGCNTPPAPVQQAVTTPTQPGVLPEPPPRPYVAMPERLLPQAPGFSPPPTVKKSLARNAKEYRHDAASHLYAQHQQRIFKGRLPPMLEAVGVIQVNIDQRGSVKAIQWQRAPKHAPRVMREIEHMVKAAAPYPVPLHMSQVTYTDVWLWHKSGKFQLDTLTEGQD